MAYMQGPLRTLAPCGMPAPSAQFVLEKGVFNIGRVGLQCRDGLLRTRSAPPQPRRDEAERTECGCDAAGEFAARYKLRLVVAHLNYGVRPRCAAT